MFSVDVSGDPAIFLGVGDDVGRECRFSGDSGP